MQKFVQELDAIGTAALPDGTSASDNLNFERLRDNIRHLHEASLGPQGVDFTFAVYARFRESSLALCKTLVDKSSQSPLLRSYQWPVLFSLWVGFTDIF